MVQEGPIQAGVVKAGPVQTGTVQASMVATGTQAVVGEDDAVAGPKVAVKLKLVYGGGYTKLRYLRLVHNSVSVQPENGQGRAVVQKLRRHRWQEYKSSKERAEKQHAEADNQSVSAAPATAREKRRWSFRRWRPGPARAVCVAVLLGSEGEELRKALCALRGMVRLEAMVRGQVVRRLASVTLRRMQALVDA
ncbi:hypothetical protein PR202_gb24189 [Eleusine coracana subsp. coracana]|uniref:Uncharacterized protein n=1 Tax=Eleusine coracana subsp. coracana TaxID=191504 RepID=A0AAV5FI76_ELECO|nr:hypothetical protein PR202_gb24189 [Eleusine coracana subsp. coracana]